MSLPLMHMDIVGSTLSLTGQWVIYKKHWWGWALCAVGNCCCCITTELYNGNHRHLLSASTR